MDKEYIYVIQIKNKTLTSEPYSIIYQNDDYIYYITGSKDPLSFVKRSECLKKIKEMDINFDRSYIFSLEDLTDEIYKKFETKIKYDELEQIRSKQQRLKSKIKALEEELLVAKKDLKIACEEEEHFVSSYPCDENCLFYEDNSCKDIKCLSKVWRF